MTEVPKPDVRIFDVDSRFQQMARRPGGVPKEAAIEQAEKQIEEMKADYVDWVDGEIQQLAAAFKTLKDDGETAPRLDDVYGRCCQLRDTGTTMGLELITFVADNLCKVLDTVKAGAPYDDAVIDCHVDAMFVARQENYRNLRPDQVIGMTNGLQKILDRAKKKSEAPTAG